MPIQFAQYSDPPFPLLFPRLPLSDSRSALPDVCPEMTRVHRDIPRAFPEKSRVPGEIGSPATVALRLPVRIPIAAPLLPPDPTVQPFDAALRPFLEATGEAEAQACLQILLQRIASPIITRVIRRKWHVTVNRAPGTGLRREEWEAEDIYSDTLALLLARLRAYQEDRSQPPISHFAAYVAMTTARVCAERLRQACPERERCRQRARYILKTHPDLTAWRDDRNRAVCGLKVWKGRSPSPAARLRLQAWEGQAHLAETVEELWTGSGLASLLAWLGGPVTQGELVSALATGLQLSEPAERRPRSAWEGQAEEADSDPLANLKDARTPVATIVEQRVYLRWLWTEILELPLRQRAALLLNLRDAQERGVLALLTQARCATRPEIARAIGLSDDALTAFLPLLPLQDDVIGELLCCTPQQVSNLRKSARARLSRRASVYERG